MLVSGSDFYCGNSMNSPCQLALKNQIPSQYVHPSTKQCNYSIDTSQFATASDLNSLKNTIGNPCKINTIYDGWYSYTTTGDFSNTSTICQAKNAPSIPNAAITKVAITNTSIKLINNTNSGSYNNKIIFTARPEYISNGPVFFEGYQFTAGTNETKSYSDPGPLITTNDTSLSLNCYVEHGGGTMYPGLNMTVVYTCYLKIIQLEF